MYCICLDLWGMTLSRIFNNTHTQDIRASHLIAPFPQPGARKVQCFLRSNFPVAAKVVTIDKHNSFFPALESGQHTELVKQLYLTSLQEMHLHSFQSLSAGFLLAFLCHVYKEGGRDKTCPSFMFCAHHSSASRKQIALAYQWSRLTIH